MTRKYDYATHFTSNTVSTFTDVNVKRFSGVYNYAYQQGGQTINTTGNVTNIDLTSFNTLNNLTGYVGEFEGFHFARTDMQGTPQPDGSTIYNVYFDRDLMLINFYYYIYAASIPDDEGVLDPYIYTATSDNSGDQYTYINGEYVKLTYRDGEW